MITLPELDINSLSFPPADSALTEPNGLLAMGGDLSSKRLLAAYRQGIFPWYCEDDPILWWCPDPRAVIFLNEFHISQRLARKIKSNKYNYTINQAFSDVISACADPKLNREDTWLSAEMIDAYCQLHQLGHAHSYEVWGDDALIGGIYGIKHNKIFFGESMFSRQTDGSKLAMAYLVEQLKSESYTLIDCQIPNDHLTSLGARSIPRADFLALIDQKT